MLLNQELPPRRTDGMTFERSHLWVVGLSIEDEPPAPPPSRTPSFVGDCECPDFCSRDHANE